VKRFVEKSVIVTGSSRGIGRAIAEAFGREGGRVVVNYLPDKPEADADAQSVVDTIRAAGGKAFAVAADVSNKAEVDAMVETTVRRFGRVDILVNNAGVCSFIDFLEFPEEEFDRHVGVIFKGVFLCSQAAARRMKETGGGAIVNVTSISGETVTDPRQSAYCSAKAAANMLTRCMAAALGPYRIRVNAVLPGTVPTYMNREQLADPTIVSAIEKRSALQRLGKPEEVARVVLFLASEESAWTTGCRLVVDGGYML